MINVTKPFLPPIEEYNQLVAAIWQRNWLTNNGPLVNDLELKLKDYLGLKHLLYVGNGTIALQIAIKALELQGEIITTPFSYVATTSSIVWEGCNPVFVDIDKDSFNIDAKKIEASITDKTSAILATHVFGNPCDIDAIDSIAKKYKLKVIYDAAHCFGTKYKGKSVFEYCDISTVSFHATKLFHTTEGGGIITTDAALLKKMSYMRNFGHSGPEEFDGLGINGKNSEFHAAMGIANLPYAGAIHNQRKKLTERYNLKLKNFKGIRPLWHKNSSSNYSYYPIVFESEAFLLKCIDILKSNEIFGRRYFYPSLSTCLPYARTKALENADDIAKRIFCLPLYYNLTIEEVDLICRLLLRVQNN